MIDHFKNPESFKDFVDTIGNIHVELDEPEESLVVWVSFLFLFIANFQICFYWNKHFLFDYSL